MFSCKQLLLCGNNLSHCITISQSASLTNLQTDLANDIIVETKVITTDNVGLGYIGDKSGYVLAQVSLLGGMEWITNVVCTMSTNSQIVYAVKNQYAVSGANIPNATNQYVLVWVKE